MQHCGGRGKGGMEKEAFWRRARQVWRRLWPRRGRCGTKGQCDITHCCCEVVRVFPLVTVEVLYPFPPGFRVRRVPLLNVHRGSV